MTTEFALIAYIQSRAPTRSEVHLGIGDDAAIVRIPPGHDLVVAMDTLNADIHFPADTAPRDIGWKALAVNLSDLAAMGAQPAFCTLSLSLPSTAIAEALLDGFFALAAKFDVALIGGDTTRGPLSLCVTAHGYVPPGQALRRDGARPGDDLWVTGTLGDAADALSAWRRGETHPLRARLDRPDPRIDAGLALRSIATACIDVSDGLAADLGHVLRASGVGATLDPHAVPGGAPLHHRLAGGDDYELCFTAPPEHRDRCARLATRIGAIEATPGLRGLPPGVDTPGWDHFR